MENDIQMGKIKINSITKSILSLLKKRKVDIGRMTLNIGLYDLKELIDLKSLITYGKILIEKDGDNVIITGYGWDNKTTEYFKCPIEYPEMNGEVDNKEVIKELCYIINTIVYEIGWSANSKYKDFRFICGLEPNSDKEFEKINKIVDKETLKKLDKAGYQLIKSVY
ncbi:MAG: hypothetical protein KAX49_13770 [Halanaerobiales bacterium]|nr:hypothetical protein [Halanaerobiales bacterium]